MKYTTCQLEELWIDLEDVTTVEGDDGLVINSDWFDFKKGTPIEDIWRWFGQNYKYGVYTLLANETPSEVFADVLDTCGFYVQDVTNDEIALVEKGTGKIRLAGEIDTKEITNAINCEICASIIEPLCEALQSETGSNKINGIKPATIEEWNDILTNIKNKTLPDTQQNNAETFMKNHEYDFTIVQTLNERLNDVNLTRIARMQIANRGVLPSCKVESEKTIEEKHENSLFPLDKTFLM